MANSPGSRVNVILDSFAHMSGDAKRAVDDMRLVGRLLSEHEASGSSDRETCDVLWSTLANRIGLLTSRTGDRQVLADAGFTVPPTADVSTRHVPVVLTDIRPLLFKPVRLDGKSLGDVARLAYDRYRATEDVEKALMDDIYGDGTMLSPKMFDEPSSTDPFERFKGSVEADASAAIDMSLLGSKCRKANRFPEHLGRPLDRHGREQLLESMLGSASYDLIIHARGDERIGTYALWTIGVSDPEFKKDNIHVRNHLTMDIMHGFESALEHHREASPGEAGELPDMQIDNVFSEAIFDRLESLGLAPEDEDHIRPDQVYRKPMMLAEDRTAVTFVPDSSSYPNLRLN